METNICANCSERQDCGRRRVHENPSPSLEHLELTFLRARWCLFRHHGGIGQHLRDLSGLSDPWRRSARRVGPPDAGLAFAVVAGLRPGCGRPRKRPTNVPPMRTATAAAGSEAGHVPSCRAWDGQGPVTFDDPAMQG